MRQVKTGIWWVGVPAWTFGICDRTIAAIADGFLSAIDLIQLFTAAFFLVCWLFLKPIRSKLEV